VAGYDVVFDHGLGLFALVQSSVLAAHPHSTQWMTRHTISALSNSFS
jgi:hypothetical protein